VMLRIGRMGDGGSYIVGLILAVNLGGSGAGRLVWRMENQFKRY
jgi:hypothetical protein